MDEMIRFCTVCERQFTARNSRQRTCLKPECIRKHHQKYAKKYAKKYRTIYKSPYQKYEYNKNEGLTLPTPKKKRIQTAMTVEEWNALPVAERWELMDLTEISREIAAMYPGKSFGHVRLLKEQGRLHEDFGKRRVEIDG